MHLDANAERKKQTKPLKDQDKQNCAALAALGLLDAL